MITTMNRIFVREQYHDLFEENFRQRSGLVDGMPGFLSNQLLRPTAPDQPFVVLTTWASRNDFETWVRSPEFRQSHARSGSLPPDIYSGSNVLELHEVVLDSTRPDLEREPHGGPFNPHGGN